MARDRKRAKQRQRQRQRDRAGQAPEVEGLPAADEGVSLSEGLPADERPPEHEQEPADAGAPDEEQFAPAAGEPRRPGGRRGGLRVLAFLRHCWEELQRVQWPDRRQVVQATGVVLGFCMLAGAFLGLMDTVFGKLVNYIL